MIMKVQTRIFTEEARLGVTYNSSTWEAEVGGLRVQDHLQIVTGKHLQDISHTREV